MSEEQLYEGQSHVIRLRIWALGQMVWGAWLAGLCVAAVGAVLLIVLVISHLLPEASKQAPSPYGMLEISQPASAVV